MKRTALVTGANRGIGLAIAKGLKAKGITVIASARTQQGVESAKSQLGTQLGLVLDLEQPAAIADQVKDFVAGHVPIDILVNNAAVLDEGEGLVPNIAALEHSLAVNTLSPYALIRALAPSMVSRGWGRIVNVSSGWGAFSDGLSGPTAYSLSKAGLNALTLMSARCLGPTVKVNAACPGWVRTRMGGKSATSSVEEGADTPIWLATLPDDGPTGGFFRNRQEISW